MDVGLKRMSTLPDLQEVNFSQSNKNNMLLKSGSLPETSKLGSLSKMSLMTHQLILLSMRATGRQQSW